MPLSFEEARAELTVFVDKLPQAIFEELNAGIVMLSSTLTDENGLLVLGQYHVDIGGLGRYITIYYGSMLEAFGHTDRQTFCAELQDVLQHELIHHLEDLAGDCSLDEQDALELARYKAMGLCSNN